MKRWRGRGQERWDEISGERIEKNGAKREKDKGREERTKKKTRSITTTHKKRDKAYHVLPSSAMLQNWSAHLHCLPLLMLLPPPPSSSHRRSLSLKGHRHQWPPSFVLLRSHLRSFVSSCASSAMTLHGHLLGLKSYFLHISYIPSFLSLLLLLSSSPCSLSSPCFSQSTSLSPFSAITTSISPYHLRLC